MLVFNCSCGHSFQLTEDDMQVVPVPFFGMASKGTIFYARCTAPGCRNVIKVFRKDDFDHVGDLVSCGCSIAYFKLPFQ